MQNSTFNTEPSMVVIFKVTKKKKKNTNESYGFVSWKARSVCVIISPSSWNHPDTQ